MAYAGLQMFMSYLKQIIDCNDIPIINNNPDILSHRPLFQKHYQGLNQIIKILSLIDQPHHHLYDLEKVRDLKKRYKDLTEKEQDCIDLFLSYLHFTNNRLYTITNPFQALLDLTQSNEVVSMTIDVNNLKIMDSSPRIDSLKTRSAGDVADTTTSSTRNPLRKKKTLMEDIVVGLDHDARIILDKLTEDTKQLAVVSIVGMGGLGKTTLATKVFNDRYVVHHFHVRAWVTVSQTYEKRDFLIQILTSIGVHEEDLEKDSDSKLREKLHKKLMGRRYLIVIDDIWSIEAWDELKLFFPHDNTRSRILLTSRLNEVGLHMKPYGFVHSLPYLTEKQSWELLKQKVFHGDECPEWSIKPGMQIAEKCHGLPLSVVVMAGVLAEEAMNKDLWENIACSVSSYTVSDQEGSLETLALSYHHLPDHLRECFLYLGGFPEDYRFIVKRLIWLLVAEGFIEEAENQSLEDTARAYLMDLINRNLLIVAERNLIGDVKGCKLHDLVRELCLQKAKEEKLFLKIDYVSSQLRPDILYQQRRVFTNEAIDLLSFSSSPTPTPTMRSFVYSDKGMHIQTTRSWTSRNHHFVNTFALGQRSSHRFQGRVSMSFPVRAYGVGHVGFTKVDHGAMRSPPLNLLAMHIHDHLIKSIACSFVLLRVLNLTFKLVGFPEELALLIHLRYLAIRFHNQIPNSICKLWSLQTLILITFQKCLYLPRKITDLVNLRHLSSTTKLYLDCIGKPMNLQSISYVEFDRVEDLHKCFPNIKKLKLHCDRDDEYHLELLPNLETLKLIGPVLRHNHLWLPATLKKLTLRWCALPWSDMSIIQSLPNLAILDLNEDAFVGTQWDASEQQFPQLKLLILQFLGIQHWEASSTSFPCLKQLSLRLCEDLEEIPLEIGEIATLELIETDGKNNSVVKSLERIQQEQHDMGYNELKITVDGVELSLYLSQHEDSESE